MSKKPTLDEVQEMEDEEVLELEADLIEQSPNQVKHTDGPQPPQDESPGLDEVVD